MSECASHTKSVSVRVVTCPSYRPNEEKVIYYLLLTRKERQPSVEDEAKAAVGGQLGQWVQVLPVTCDSQHCIVPFQGPSHSVGPGDEARGL